MTLAQDSRDVRVAEMPTLGAKPPLRSLRLVVFLALTIIVPPVLLVQPDTAQGNRGLVGLRVLILAISAARLVSHIGDNRRQPMQLVFWLFSYVWLGLAGLLQVLSRQNPFNIIQADDIQQTSGLMLLLGFAGYEAGVRLGRRRPVAQQLREARSFSLPRVQALAAVTILTLPFFVAKLGGLATLFSSRHDLEVALTNVGLISDSSKSTLGIYTALATVPCFVLGAVLLQTKRRAAGNVLLLGLVICNVIVNNPISNPRYWFGTLGFALFFSVKRIKRRITWEFSIVSLLLMLIVVFPFADRYRYSQDVQKRYSVSQAFVGKGDYDASAQMDNAVQYAQDIGYSEGRQITTALLFWVPRAVWNGKSADTGTLIGKHLNYPNLNLSAPLWAEFYVDFGPSGVFVGMLLLGFASRRSDEAFEVAQNGRQLSLAAVLVPILAGYEVILLRGSLLQAIGRLVILLGFCYFLTSLRAVQTQRITVNRGP